MPNYALTERDGKILTDFNENILMWNKILSFSDFNPEIQILITSRTTDVLKAEHILKGGFRCIYLSVAWV